MFACLSGMAPQPADQRVVKERMQPCAKLFKGKYSKEMLDIIDWCLLLDHLKRPQSGFSLQKALVENRGPVMEKPGVFDGVKRMFDGITRPTDKPAKPAKTSKPNPANSAGDATK